MVPQMANLLVTPQFITNKYNQLWGTKNHHVFVRRVSVATSGDLKSRHKGWFVAKKHVVVMKIFTTKTLCPCSGAAWWMR
jgi:hypothetical protein